MLIKAVTKHLHVFYLEYQNLEDWHIFQLQFILVNADRLYDIMPIKRLRKKTKLPSDTKEMLYVH